MLAAGSRNFKIRSRMDLAGEGVLDLFDTALFPWGFGQRRKEQTMSKSSTTTKRKFPPVHPARILAEDLNDAGMSMNQLAKANRCSDEPHRRDRQRAARHHCRDHPYGSRAIGALRLNTG
jgi:hypothetical protein